MLPAYNTRTNEKMYTDDEWVKEYYKRKLGLRIRRQTWFTEMKQHLYGLALAVVGIAAPLLLDGDATFTFVTLPLGLYLIFTKEKIIK